MSNITSWLQKTGWSFKPLDSENDGSGITNIKQGYIAPKNDDASYVLGDAGWGSFGYSLTLDQSFVSDFEQIARYRSTALQPECDRAINEIVNEAIDGTTKSAPVEINLDNLEISESIKKKIKEEHKKICQLLNFNNESYEIFRKWYVDGKIHFQIVIDTEKPSDGIQELRYVSPLNIKKIREEKSEMRNGIPVVTSYEEFFVYSKNMQQLTGGGGIGAIGQINSQALKITADSIAYCNSGLVQDERNIVFSYLEKAVRPTNQLRMMEEAVIIYRISRAPERRIFYIDVGNMPAKKAEEALKNIMNRYKNTIVYDAVTGEVKDNKNTLSMMQDYWMPRRNGQTSTEITTLQSSGNAQPLDDLDYFKKKMLESLNVPLGRLMSDESPGFGIGRSSEISREEVGFAAFIDRLRKRFSGLFMDLLKKQLIMKKIISPDDWQEMSHHISYDFASNTYFDEMKDMEILRERLATVQLMDPQPAVGTYYSREWVKKNILKLTDDEIKQMQDQIDEEGSAPQEQDPNAMMGMGMGGPEMPPQGPQDPSNLITSPEEQQQQDSQMADYQGQMQKMQQKKPQQKPPVMPKIKKPEK